MKQPWLAASLTVKDARAAIEFYGRVFQADEVGPRLTDPGGRIVHTERRIGDSLVMLSDEHPEYGNLSPETVGGTPVRLHLEVPDVDAVVARAVESGAEVLIPVADQFYGHRAGRFADPFGHVWVVSTRIEDVSHDEMQRRLDAMLAGPEP